jgi:hypothetical protein
MWGEMRLRLMRWIRRDGKRDNGVLYCTSQRANFEAMKKQMRRLMRTGAGRAHEATQRAI